MGTLSLAIVSISIYQKQLATGQKLGLPLHLLKYDLQILTDASRRVSAHLGEHSARGTWSLPEASYT